MRTGVENDCDRGESGIDPSLAATNNEPSSSLIPKRNYKPIKRKKGVLSSSKRGGKQKRSSYDFDAANEALGIDPSAIGGQQIVSAIMKQKASLKPPPIPPSPDKKAVKRQNKKLKHDSESLKKVSAKDKKKIAAQDSSIRDLLQQLRLEKRASNTIINDTMSKAVESMDEAIQLREQAKVYETEVESKLVAEVEQHKEQLREERKLHSSETARMKTKIKNTLQKQQDEHESAMKAMRAKYDKKKVSP